MKYLEQKVYQKMYSLFPFATLIPVRRSTTYIGCGAWRLDCELPLASSPYEVEHRLVGRSACPDHCYLQGCRITTIWLAVLVDPHSVRGLFIWSAWMRWPGLFTLILSQQPETKLCERVSPEASRKLWAVDSVVKSVLLAYCACLGLK